MTKIDLYSFVHKPQRARLFGLVVEAGMVDPGDAPATAALSGAVRALTHELRTHAMHEDTFIHPLLRKLVPAVAEQLEAEHEHIDERLVELERTARATTSIACWPASQPSIFSTSNSRRTAPCRPCGRPRRLTT